MTAADQEAFRRAEATLRLEGLDPAGNELYESLKAQVVAGALTLEQAEALTLDHFKSVAAKSAANAA